MKCLRCGTELKDSTMFCPECTKVTAVPLQSSAYLNRKISLPKRKPAQSIKKPDPKLTAPKNRRVGGWILLSALLLLVCALFLLQGVYTYDQKQELSQELARLQGVEDECVRLTDKLRQAEAEAEALEQELSSLGSSSYLIVRRELKNAQTKNANLTRELNRTQDELKKLTEQLQQLREKADFLDAHIVFLQDEDPTVFHSYSCEKFTRNGYRAYNKQQALSLGYTPCPHCQ